MLHGLASLAVTLTLNARQAEVRGRTRRVGPSCAVSLAVRVTRVGVLATGGVLALGFVVAVS